MMLSIFSLIKHCSVFKEESWIIKQKSKVEWQDSKLLLQITCSWDIVPIAEFGMMEHFPDITQLKCSRHHFPPSEPLCLCPHISEERKPFRLMHWDLSIYLWKPGIQATHPFKVIMELLREQIMKVPNTGRKKTQLCEVMAVNLLW